MILYVLVLGCRSPPSNSSAFEVRPAQTGDCLLHPWFLDQDGDGFGSGPTQESCVAPLGWVDNGGDCQDGDAAIHPLMAEVPYDGIDQDCDGTDLRDADGDGDPVETDCDDADDTRASTFFERCNTGVDEDCDGVIDEDCQYFGGVANGEPDTRILGVWVDGWSNMASTGRFIYTIGDMDEDGLADFGFNSTTYRQDNFHFVTGAQLTTSGDLTVDDAVLSLSQDTDGAYWDSPVILNVVQWAGDRRLLVGGTSEYRTVSTDETGSISTDVSLSTTRADDYISTWRDRGVHPQVPHAVRNPASGHSAAGR